MGFGDWVKKQTKAAVKKAAPVAAKVPGAKTVAAAGLRAVGSVANPGSDTRDRFFTVAKNITNPNVSYTGASNPRSGGGGGGSPSPFTLADVDMGSVQGLSTSVPSGGIYTGSGGSDEPYDFDTDPGRIAGLRGDITGRMGMFEQAFTDALGMIDRLAAQKKQQIVDNYATQREGLGNTYTQGSQQIANVHAGRNTANSSFAAEDQGQAKTAYETALTGLGKAEQEDLGEVGQFVTSQREAFNAGRPDFDVNNYNSVSDLLNVREAVDQAIKGINQTRAGLGTTPENVAALSRITPEKETGSAAIKSQLDRLASVNAPAETKRVIAAEAARAAGEDEEQWLDYFDRVLQSQGSQATGIALA